MKKAERIFSGMVLVMISVSLCFLRLFQLLRYTDKQTGFVTSADYITYIIYGLLFVGTVFCAFFSFWIKKRQVQICFADNKSIYVSSVLLSGTYFFDFLHQCLNCFRYVEGKGVGQLSYIIFYLLTAVCALLCCFYFFAVSMTAKKLNFDFTRLAALHFVPIIWAFLKLVLIMTQILDVRMSVQSVCEFLFLISFICFDFCFIGTADKNNSTLSASMCFFSMTAFMTSVTVSLPRIIALLLAKGSMIDKVGFTAVTYLMAGIFAFVLAVANKNDGFEKRV